MQWESPLLPFPGASTSEDLGQPEFTKLGTRFRKDVEDGRVAPSLSSKQDGSGVEEPEDTYLQRYSKTQSGTPPHTPTPAPQLRNHSETQQRMMPAAAAHLDRGAESRGWVSFP